MDWTSSTLNSSLTKPELPNLLIEETSEAEDCEAQKELNDQEEDDELFPLEVSRGHAERPADAGQDGQQQLHEASPLQCPVTNKFLFLQFKTIDFLQSKEAFGSHSILSFTSNVLS